MWKHTCQCLILLALASLPCAHPTQAAMMVKDAEEQIHLITDARDIWDLSEPGMDTVGYMCSDLDGMAAWRSLSQRRAVPGFIHIQRSTK